MDPIIAVVAAYLVIGIIVAFTLGRKWAAVPLRVVVLVWPKFVIDSARVY